MRKFRRYAVATLFVVGSWGAGVAVASAYASGHNFMWESISADACYYGRATSNVPSGSWDLDFNAWAYKRDRNNGCGINYATKNFGDEGHLIDARLFRASDGALCSNTNTVVIPSGSSSYGIGRGWNHSGACASASNFSMYARTQRLDALGYSTFLTALFNVISYP